jgi:hypothetical protein
VFGARLAGLTLASWLEAEHQVFAAPLKSELTIFSQIKKTIPSSTIFATLRGKNNSVIIPLKPIMLLEKSKRKQCS